MRDRWQEYERRKRLLQSLDLSPSDYEKAIRLLIRELGL